MASNFSVLGNKFARTFVEVQCEPNPQYQALKNYLKACGLGGDHNRDLAIMGVNNDPDKSGNDFASAPFLLIIVPTFVPFDVQLQPSHQAASIAGYFTNGVASFNAVVTTISHNPVQFSDFTLVELDPNNNIVTTPVTREQLQNNTPGSLADLMGMANIDPNQWNAIWPTLGQTDLAAATVTVLGTLATDDYEGPLYGPGGLATLLDDSTVASRFAQAISLRTAVGQGVAAMAGSSCCGGCSTTSKTTVGFGGFGGGDFGGGGASGSW
jgi:uncharacterized membrane protein YgcG